MLSLTFFFSQFCWRLVFPSRSFFSFRNKNNCCWMSLQWRKIYVSYHQVPYCLLCLSCFLLEAPLLLNLDEVAMEDTCFEYLKFFFTHNIGLFFSQSLHFYNSLYLISVVYKRYCIQMPSFDPIFYSFIDTWQTKMTTIMLSSSHWDNIWTLQIRERNKDILICNRGQNCSIWLIQINFFSENSSYPLCQNQSNRTKNLSFANKLSRNWANLLVIKLRTIVYLFLQRIGFLLLLVRQNMRSSEVVVHVIHLFFSGFRGREVQ